MKKQRRFALTQEQAHYVLIAIDLAQKAINHSNNQNDYYYDYLISKLNLIKIDLTSYEWRIEK